MFPAHWLLDLHPDGNDNWRYNYHRCCYQCASGTNDDYVWHLEHLNFSPAIHDPTRHLSVSRRVQVLQLGSPISRGVRCGHLLQASHLGHSSGPGDQHQRRLCGALWDNNKLRWVRRTVLTPGGDDRRATKFTIDAWYQLCEKVRKIKRDKMKGRAKQSGAHWVSHVSAGKTRVRNIVRGRVLQMVDTLVVDIQAEIAADAANLLQIFRRWDVDHIQSVLE